MRRSPWPRSVRGRLAALSAFGGLAIGTLTGVLLLARLRDEVANAVDAGLATRADDIEASVRDDTVELAQEEAFAQITTSSGDVLVSSSTIRDDTRVLTLEETAKASVVESVFERDVAGLGGRARLLARPIRSETGEVIVVVGSSIDSEARAHEHLQRVVLLTVPAFSALLGAAAWWVAGRALRPAERMAEEAETISLTEPGHRLPVPAGDHELAHLGESLNAMLDRLEASYERERAFLDDASHELRTPLSILRGELELTLAEADDPAAVRASLESALEEADRLAAITADLLTLARADGGGLPLEIEEIDVLAACERTRDRVAHDGVAVEVGGDEATAFVDPRRLEQILENLLANAVRHARATVRVTVRAGADRAWVEVADDGDGFPADLLPRAFERFTRSNADRHRGEGRTGLGLAIVDVLTAAQGGAVDATNGGPLGGAVVTLTLPGGPASGT